MRWHDGWLVLAVLLVAGRAARMSSELAWIQALWMLSGAAALLLLSWGLTGHSAWWLRSGLVAAAAAQVPLMLWQAAHGLPAVGWTPGPGSRSAGAMLAVAVPLAPWWLWGWFAAGLLASQSYLALAAAAVGTYIMIRRWPKAPKAPGPWVWVPFGATVGLLALVLWFARDVPLPAWRERLAVWRLAWPDLAAHPWLGMGPGGWGTTIAMRQWTGSQAELWTHAHSDLVQWVYESGAVGVALLVGWVAAHAPIFWTSEARGAVVALAIVATGFTVFHYGPTLPWVVLVLGLALREETL